jgi:hypothetical protein
MLQAMQQTAAATPSPHSPNFAGILAAFAAPAKQARDPGDRSSSQGRQRTPAWSDDGLADDYATLSYERALRAHARYRSADDSDSSLKQSGDLGPISIHDVNVAAPEVTPQSASPTTVDRNLKSASITIRLSKAECAQLRKRAAEAGLTVSAYLRSCTFEAESLRALVKDTLAQLRSDTGKGGELACDQPAASRAVSRPIRRSLRQWLARFWPHTHASRRIAQA